MANASLPDLKDVSLPVLERYLRRLFALADTDNNGVLDQREFSNLLSKSGLGFPDRLVRKVMLEADVNNDGVISYEEYVPVMLEIIQANRVVEYKAEDEAKAHETAVAFLLNGVSPEQIERQITRTFMQADVDNSGALDREEFVDCMRALDLGLTKKEILYLMSVVDVNGDGLVQYEEFVPLCIDILASVIQDKILESSSKLDLQRFFLETFSKYDSEGAGCITISQLRDALGGIGLSTIQIQTVVSEADTDAGGKVKYHAFARVVAQMFSDFFQWRSAEESSVEDTREVAQSELEDSTMAPAELERYLRQLFYQADVESNGYLAPRDFGQLLRSSGLGFSSKTIRKVIEEADIDGDGRIDYLEYVGSMVSIVQAQQAKNKVSGKAWEDEARARAAATDFLLQGVSRDWLERSMLKMFMQADVNNSGNLDTAEFIAALRSLDLGLTRKEITYIMSEVDLNRDGLVSYQEFVPLCFDLLVELIKDKFLEDQGSLRLQEYLVDILKEYDHKGTGKISISQLREALSLSSLGLSAVQVQAICSEARQDESGLIAYQPFSRAAAMLVSGMLGEVPAAASEYPSAIVTSMTESQALVSAVTLAPEVEAMVNRYEGDYEAVKARSLASTPGLKGKLSDLASQLARVQDENDSIRQRYLELEDAWTTMGDENAALQKRVVSLDYDLDDKSSALDTSLSLNSTLETKLEEVHKTFLHQRTLAEETKQTLISEQLELGKKTKESDLLRRETMSQETELRKLRDAWNERESRLQRVEGQRDFYEQQLGQLGEAYQGLVDKLQFVVADQSVRTAPLQVRVGGSYEVLGNYLGKVFNDESGKPKKYSAAQQAAPLSPYKHQAFPISVTPATSPRARTRLY